MSELNKVPGLFPKKPSLRVSNTVSVRSESLNTYSRIFGLTLYLTGVFSLTFSLALFPVVLREPLELAGRTQNVYHGFTHDPVHWWKARLLLLLKRSLRTSSALCVEETMIVMKNR